MNRECSYWEEIYNAYGETEGWMCHNCGHTVNYTSIFCPECGRVMTGCKKMVDTPLYLIMKGSEIMTEMQKLDKYLTEHNIRHTYKRRWPEFDKQQKTMRVTATGAIYHTMKENAIDGGWQIVVNDENGEYLFDAICGYGSFGFNQGLIEIMGCIVPDDVHDSVEGFLTADEVIERIEKYYASNGLVINN